MRRPLVLAWLFALFLLTGGIALAAAAPSITITGTAPGLGVGSIDVSYTYKNAPTATGVRYTVSNPPNNPQLTVFPIGANGKGSNTVSTQWGNTTVTVVVELLDVKGQVIPPASAPVQGKTK